MSATTNLGKVSVTPKGAWASTNTYEILDIVTSGGSSYLAKQDVPTGVQLSNTSYWIMIAEKGDGGEVTSASASISGGYGTPGVSVTAGGTAHERTLAFAFTNLRGEKGETGNGIDSVYKTGTSGLVDTYTILFTDGSTYEFEVNNGTASIDDTLTKSGWAADAKVVGDTKASIDGFYETMGVGVADNLTPYSEDSGASQDIPFIAQGTGCGNGESVVDTGSYCQLKKKLGNTVAVNQLVGTMTDKAEVYGVTRTAVDSGKKMRYQVTTCTQTTNYTAYALSEYIAGHIYLVSLGNVALPAGTRLALRSVDQATSYVGTLLTQNIGVYITSGVTNADFTVEPICIDLTLWFGSNDRIPSDLLAHPENWGRYYAGSLDYAAGYLDSADGTVMKSVGRNIFDKDTMTVTDKYINDSNGNANTLVGSICTDFIEVIPNTAYYIKTDATSGRWGAWYDADKNYVSGISGPQNKTAPANARYIRFTIKYGNSGDGNKDTFCISLYYPGESGYDQYYPFSVLAEVDTGSEVLRGVEGSRDEKLPSGTIIRNRARIDLGTLNWGYTTSYGRGVFYADLADRKVYNTTTTPEFICPLYVADNSGGPSALASKGNMLIAATITATQILITNDSYSNAATFKTAMSGVYLEYPLATPTTEQGTAFAENIPCDDFGSMYWTQTKGIPQGNEIFYPVDYKASIDTLYNRVEGDMGAIVIDSQLEIVADRIPEAPSEDGTYTLKATVSSGTKTYSWVADE